MQLALARAASRSVRLGVAMAVVTAFVVTVSPLAIQPVEAQPAQRTLIEVLSADPQFSTFVQLLGSADLTERLREPGPYTVWAPTNDAFNKLPPARLDAWRNDPQELRAVMSYHVASGALTAAQAVQVPTLKTLEGEPIAVNVLRDAVLMNDANVSRPDVLASNGVIHVVDGVLVPPSRQAPNRLPVAGEADVPAADVMVPAALAGVLFVVLGGWLLRRRAGLAV